MDLVSYNQKHNEANGENNNDGANENHSWNHGAEGPTEDPGFFYKIYLFISVINIVFVYFNYVLNSIY